MAAIPLILNRSSAGSTERGLKYFIIQIISGLVVLTIIVSDRASRILLELIIILKLGGFPFFIWVPHVYRGLSYYRLGLIGTLLKLPSLIIFRALASSVVIFLAGVSSILIGSITGVLLTRVKKLLAYSSVSQSGWLIILAFQTNEWGLYFIIYRLITIVALIWLNLNRFKRTYQIIRQSKSHISITIIILIRLAGFPPTLGFNLKIFSLSNIIVSYPGLVLLVIGRLVVRVYYYFSMFIHSWLLINKPVTKSIMIVKVTPIIIALIFSPLLL